MKITEIDNTLEEGLGKLIGKGLSWAGSKLAGGGARTAAVEKIASQWTDDIVKASATGTKTVFSKIQDKSLRAMVRADRSIMDDAAKLAQKTAISQGIKGSTKAIARKVGKTWWWTRTIGKTGFMVYNTYQIAQFFTQYNDNVNAWDKELKSQLAAGKITEEQYKEQLAYIRKTEMGLLIPKVGAALLGSAIIKGTAVPIAALLKASKITAPLGSIVSGLGSLGVAYLYTKLNSKEGSEMFARVLTGNALGDTATAIMGTAGTEALDWLTGTAKEAQKADQQSAPTNATAGQAQQPAQQTAQQPAQGATTTPAAAPAATAPAVSNKDEYTPKGYKRDAKGNLILDLD